MADRYWVEWNGDNPVLRTGGDGFRTASPAEVWMHVEIERLKDMVIHDHARLRLENEQLRAELAKLRGEGRHE